MWLQSAVLVTIVSSVIGQYILRDNFCLSNTDCPGNLACIKYSCIDPCRLNVCGTNNTCTTTDHTPSCTINCPRIRVLARKYSRKMFTAYSNEVNWYEALMYCGSKGMALATVESQREQERLEVLLNEMDGAWWLGGSAWLKKTELTWTSTGEPLTYTNFAEYQPNNFLNDNGERDNCLEIKRNNSDYKWFDEMCSFRHGFICEYYI